MIQFEQSISKFAYEQPISGFVSISRKKKISFQGSDRIGDFSWECSRSENSVGFVVINKGGASGSRRKLFFSDQGPGASTIYLTTFFKRITS